MSLALRQGLEREAQSAGLEAFDEIVVEHQRVFGQRAAFVVRQQRRELVDQGDPEPRFVTDFFYFLEWTSEPGEYYFVGRETVAGREVVRIEFYPTGPFREEAGERINRGIVKTSMVTLWIDPEIHQIVQYAFENAGLDFLRFRWLLRADGLQAVMELAPVRGVWMPARMTLSGRATTALGEYAATFTQEFFDYRQADTGARLADPENDR